MKEKRDIQALIVREEPHLNNLLDKAQVEKFKEMTSELRDTWTKKQMHRTRTEMEFSVLNDAKFPTNAAKYWQCVREQNTQMENLMQLSFEYRKTDIKIKKLEKKLERALMQVDIDQMTFDKATHQLVASHRMREVSHWSDFKKLYNDGTFDDKNVDTHQLLSYKKTMKNRENTLSAASTQPEIFNVIGQMRTIERVEKERKTLKSEKRAAIERK